MVWPIAIGLGLQAVGSIFSGRSKTKAANKAAAEGARLQAEQELENLGRHQADLAAVASLHQQDEARLRSLAGVDFEKLVSDAQAAGFNPLTALAAAGTGAYQRANSFIQSPFLPRPLMNNDGRVELARDVAGTAGYFGSALSGLGSGIVSVSQEAARLRADAAIASAANSASGRSGSLRVPAAGSFPTASVTDARPGVGNPASPFWATLVSGFENFIGGRDAFGFPDAFVRPGADRATDLERVKNTPWFKETQLWGETLVGWNDEFMDSELASTASLISLPVQWLAKQAVLMDLQGIPGVRKPLLPPVRNPTSSSRPPYAWSGPVAVNFGLSRGGL